MNSKLMRLEPPYAVIYAGGKVGRHIATLLTWYDNEDAERDGAEISLPSSYPVIDEGEETPAGTLIDTELHDCRVIATGRQDKVSLYWLNKIVEHDLQQPLPSEVGYIGERLRLLGIGIALPTAKNEDGTEYEETDFKVSLSFESFGDRYIVRSNPFTGCYMEARGTRQEVIDALHYQRVQYESLLMDRYVRIDFVTPDGWEQDIVDELNAMGHA